MNLIITDTDSDLQRKLVTQVAKRMPYLTSGEVYTLAAILGETFWEEEDQYCHKALGRAFSGLVEEGRLPFEGNGLTRIRHNEYKYAPYI
jgi:hypothetical protein